MIEYHYLRWMFQSAIRVFFLFFFLVFLFYRQYWSLPSRKAFLSEAPRQGWIGAMTQAKTSAQPSAGGHKQLLHEEQDMYRPWPFAFLPSRNLTWSLVFHSQPKPGIFSLSELVQFHQIEQLITERNRLLYLQEDEKWWLNMMIEAASCMDPGRPWLMW